MDNLIPPAIDRIFGEDPLLAREDSYAYRCLLAQLAAESGVTTTIDWMTVKDVADLTWQIARYRRWISAYLDNGERLGLASAIEQVIGSGSGATSSAALKLAHGAYNDFGEDVNDPADGERRVIDLLDNYGLRLNEVGAAHSFFRNLPSIMMAEELVTRLERRRERTLKQLDARQRSSGSALRSAVNRVVDVELVQDPSRDGPSLSPVDDGDGSLAQTTHSAQKPKSRAVGRKPALVKGKED